jgi:2-dehydro-3-deoxyphosphogluconate aldolase / (4S)-4-hydroxy-2-oxoglutarate aldolase
MRGFGGTPCMTHHEILSYILRNKIIAIVRADTGGEDLVRTVEAVAEGGVRCIEVTMTTPGALQCIETAAARLGGADVLLGVGSVLDAETARMAILSGAEYVVSPIASKGVIDMAHRYGKVAMPGALTPNEIFAAWEMGGDIIKVFPATLGGLEYVKAVRAPMPQIPLCPTGGVDLDNICTWFSAGVSAVGIGTNLVSKALIQQQDFASLTELARHFAQAVR